MRVTTIRAVWSQKSKKTAREDTMFLLLFELETLNYIWMDGTDGQAEPEILMLETRGIVNGNAGEAESLKLFW